MTLKMVVACKLGTEEQGGAWTPLQLVPVCLDRTKPSAEVKLGAEGEQGCLRPC